MSRAAPDRSSRDDRSDCSDSSGSSGSSARIGASAASTASRASTAPRRILFVDHAAALGGAEISLLGLLAALDRGAWEPHLATVPGRLSQLAAAAGVTVHHLPLRRLQRDGGGGSWAAPWHLLRGTWALAALARRLKVGLLHANVLRAAVYTAPAARLAGRPWVWHVRDILRPTAIVRLLCQEADAVVAISRAVALALPCASRARVIANPVAAPPPRRRSRESLGLPQGRLLASVGRLRPWKGHHRFVSMADHLAARDVHLLIIGGRDLGEDGEDLAYAEALQRQAAALGLANRVHLLGERGDLADLWPHLSALVHAADAEPFGRVIAEAQLAGVPVVAFADGGVPELIEDGVDGLLAPPSDEAALARAADRLLSDPALAERLATRAAARARAAYAPEAHAAAMSAVFRHAADT